MEHPFEIGKEYRNRNGYYEVLSIEEPTMRVRYEGGEEDDLSISNQTYFWKMWSQVPERPPPVVVKKQRGKSKKAGRRKSPAESKQEKRVAEILKDDKTVYEILSRLTIPPGQIALYRHFLKHPDDYFSLEEIAEAVRSGDMASERGVFMALGRRIGATPDERVRDLKPLNSLFFQRRKSGGKTVMRIRPRVVEIFKSYTKFYDFLINKDDTWLSDEFGSQGWEDTPETYKAQMAYFGFSDLDGGQEESVED